VSVRAGIEASAQAIETLAVVVIVVVIAVATAHYLLGYLSRLEILVAADVVRTVTMTLDHTLRSIAGLGLLVLIRTFLSWSLMLEIEGRWPWQRRGDGARPSTAKDHEQRARMAL
jgi:hypothetical protein